MAENSESNQPSQSSPSASKTESVAQADGDTKGKAVAPASTPIDSAAAEAPNVPGKPEPNAANPTRTPEAKLPSTKVPAEAEASKQPAGPGDLIDRSRLATLNIFAVIGETGTGKTTFINNAIGSKLEVGHNLNSCTEDIATATGCINGQTVTLVDTPGFDDCVRNEDEILEITGVFLKAVYDTDPLLHGVIYLRRINDNRRGGSPLRSIRILKSLCNTRYYCNIALVTTGWSTIDVNEGERRENELKDHDHHWKYMIAQGAKVFRHDKGEESAKEIVGQLLAKLEDQLYKPLSFEKSEIRLLRLALVKSKGAPLKCTLLPVPLPRAPSYVALSYHWGDPNNTTTIEVNGIKRQVTINLEAALRRLQAEGVDTVWADALCINQRDKEERSIQVARIGSIFRKATEVAVWLGDELDIDTDAVQSLCARTTKELCRDTYLSTLPAFKHLLDRPYWRRVWIIQELAVASLISVYCGHYRIPWQAIDITSNYYVNRNVVDTRDHSVMEDIPSFTTVRRVRTDVLARRPIGLLDVLRRTRSSLATDPRDKIFALLGLTFDGKFFIHEPSYMVSVSDSFTAFATALIESNEPLDIIYLRSANRKIDGELPSWVPDWTDLDDPVARRQLDCIVDQFSPWVKSSRAGDICEVAKISISGAKLEATGVLFDTVDGLGSSLATTGDTFAYQVALSYKSVNPYKKTDDKSSIVYRTLVSTELFPNAAHETLDDAPGDLWGLWSIENVQQMREAQLGIVSLGLASAICTWLAENRNFVIYGQTLERWTKAWSQSSNKNDSVKIKRQFFNAIQSRMRLLTTERGYLGWAHPQARIGDRIAILFGCCRPVILRAYQDGYRVVGDACLSGQSISDLWEMALNNGFENVRIL